MKSFGPKHWINNISTKTYLLESIMVVANDK